MRTDGMFHFRSFGPVTALTGRILGKFWVSQFKRLNFWVYTKRNNVFINQRPHTIGNLV